MKTLKIATLIASASAALVAMTPAAAADTVSAAAATTAAAATPQQKAKADPAKKYCITLEAVTGSRVGKRQCLTKAQWEARGLELTTK